MIKLRLKKLKWKLESVKDCKLVFQHSEQNGHDCWGNLDWITYKAVYCKGKIQHVWDDMWVLHDGMEVKELVWDFQKKNYEQGASRMF